MKMKYRPTGSPFAMNCYEWYDEGSDYVEVSLCPYCYNKFKKQRLFDDKTEVMKVEIGSVCGSLKREGKECTNKASYEVIIDSNNVTFNEQLRLEKHEVALINEKSGMKIAPYILFEIKGFDVSELRMYIADSNSYPKLKEVKPEDNEYRLCVVLISESWGIGLDYEIMENDEVEEIVNLISKKKEEFDLLKEKRQRLKKEREEKKMENPTVEITVFYPVDDGQVYLRTNELKEDSPKEKVEEFLTKRGYFPYLKVPGYDGCMYNKKVSKFLVSNI